MLGEAFYKNFKNENILKCTDIDLNEEWLSYLDFREFESYKNDVLDFNPNYLIHLGAFTDLEHCERNIDRPVIQIPYQLKMPHTLLMN